MCGINGIIRKKRCENIEQRIVRMNQLLKHRGPDAGREYINAEKNIALGHRRLSIIDIDTRSNQPMMSNSKRWILVYNGEVYNYKELQRKTNYQYHTTSDTEVVLAYLECFGIEEFLKKCNGMFAFAAYDAQEQKMYLCRDRLGIKPLFYYLDGEQLIFSSEIKGILHSGLVEAILNEDAIDDYLGYRYVREPNTFFKGIKQVEAGCYIQIDSNLNSQAIRYWDIPKNFNFDMDYNEEEICLEFKEKLERAVLKRTIADVPLGTYLSGGVDSSVLTAIVAQNTSKRVNTYTIGFEELNEFTYSDQVAKKYNTIHHKILMTREEYLDYMKEVISYKDAPLGVPNEIPLAIMSKELKKDITVVLSGEGADELLGGYGRIFRSPFEYENSDDKRTFYDYFIGKYEYVPRKIRDMILDVSTNYRKDFDEKIAKDFYGRRNEYNIFYFFHKYHVKGLLQRVDTTTMLASVEARVPFLDHELVEYSYNKVPYDLKLHWKSVESIQKARSLSSKEFSEVYDVPKYLLRQVAKEYIPVELISRRKVGFPVPLGQWNAELFPLVQEELSKALWVKKASLQELITQCKNYESGNQFLWMFLNVQLFINMYFCKEWRY